MCRRHVSFVLPGALSGPSRLAESLKRSLYGRDRGDGSRIRSQLVRCSCSSFAPPPAHLLAEFPSPVGAASIHSLIRFFSGRRSRRGEPQKDEAWLHVSFFFGSVWSLTRLCLDPFREPLVLFSVLVFLMVEWAMQWRREASFPWNRKFFFRSFFSVGGLIRVLLVSFYLISLNCFEFWSGYCIGFFESSASSLAFSISWGIEFGNGSSSTKLCSPSHAARKPGVALLIGLLICINILIRLLPAVGTFLRLGNLQAI